MKEMKKEEKMVLYCGGYVLDWGAGDVARPGVWPGKGMFAHGGLSSFVPRAHVSMFGFAMVSL